MNVFDILTVIIVAALIGAAVFILVRDRKKECGGCGGGDCASCVFLKGSGKDRGDPGKGCGRKR
ncbi:MAG: hypothetical protein IJU52_01075 [Clostridia bacterium]|nr:hypothetical protein [Clostridia bacterium]